jgi:exopolysaccharide biosynthesis polyprenyl glycosylphosphotransferase
LITAIKLSAKWVLPAFLENLSPSALGSALLDLALIWFAYIFQTLLLGPVDRAQSLGLSSFCFYVMAFLAFAVQERFYGRKVYSASAEILSAFKVILWVTVLTGFALKLSHAGASFVPLFFLSGESFCLLILSRHVCMALGIQRAGLRRVVVIGEQNRAEELAAAIRRDQSSEYLITGVISEDYCREFGCGGLDWIAREKFLDGLIVASSDPRTTALAVEEARCNHLEVHIVPELFGAKPKEISFERNGSLPVIRMHTEHSPEWTLALKRIADVVLTSVGLVALLPVMFGIAALVKMDSSGPVLYRAPRVGRKGQRFTCFKFRTMVREANALKQGLRSRNERDGAFFKLTNDPRITRVGRLLRRYSLDELPQLWNVLRGEMSLVGPRPHPPDDVERYRFQDLQRLDFIPGMTGLWPVTARRDASFERSVALDVEYIRSWSFWLDIRILFKTISAALQGRGA